VTTVIEAATLCDSLAVTVTLERADAAKARQISAVPNCAFVRRTSAHVRLAPVTPVTVIPAEFPSVATKASSNSFPEAVLNVGVAIVVAELDRSVAFSTSTARLLQAGVVARTINISFNASRLARASHEHSDKAFELNMSLSSTS
jgi:hypothetical protein